MIAPQKPWRRRSPEEISRIITQLEQSSLSARQFATSHGLSYSSLTAWVRKRRQGKNSKANSAPWLELKPTPLPSNPEYEIASPSGWRLRVSSGFTPSEAKVLIELLNISCSR